MEQTPKERDAAISRYVIRLQERYPQFARERRAEMRLRGYDPLTLAVSERVWFGSRDAYAKMLAEMLSEEERHLLRHDENFTEAWRVFMDLCWMRKQFERLLLLAGGILLVVLLLGGLAWAGFELIKSVLTPRK